MTTKKQPEFSKGFQRFGAGCAFIAFAPMLITSIGIIILIVIGIVDTLLHL